MLTIEQKIAVYCYCGTSLNATLLYGRSGGVEITITPCPDCMAASYKQGHDDGFEERAAQE